MLYKYGIDPDITAMVDQFEWYIVPVANPDGYAYTWTDVGYLSLEFCNTCADPEGRGQGVQTPPWKITKI